MKEDDGEQKTPIQIDVYGIKIRATPQPNAEPDPTSWSEVGRRLNQSLMAIVAGVGRLVERTVKAAISLMNGIGDLGSLPKAIEQRISKSHDLADAEESRRFTLPAPSRADAEQRLRAILLRMKAKGLSITTKAEAEILAIAITAPVEDDVAEEILDRAISTTRQLAKAQATPTSAEATPPSPSDAPTSRSEDRKSDPTEEFESRNVSPRGKFWG